MQLKYEAEQVNQPLPVRADAKWMIRALDNLITNALKFSNKGGLVKINCRRKRDEAVLTVADNGVGIPDSILPTMFTKYSTPSRMGTAGEQGTGLGLSIVKQIIDMQEGKIGVTSTEGLGSCFEIRLPIAG